MLVRDNNGDTSEVQFTGRRSMQEFTNIRGGLDFRPFPALQVAELKDNGKLSVFWAPIFVDWFIEDVHTPTIQEWSEMFW